MAETHDFLALDWVKGEIEETLKQAQQALEAFVDNPEDKTRLRFCLTYLHQVYGTLQMVEFYGAALLAEEMEHLTQAMINGKVARMADAQETLMRGMLQLPAYLDRIKASRRDLPVVLMPLLNDIRAARGEKLLSEGALFKPDMSKAAGAGEVSKAVAADPNLAELLKKIRQMYQLALLGFIRGENLANNIGFMAKVAQKLEKVSGDAAISPLWKVVGAVIEGLGNQSIDGSTAVKLLLGQVDRQIKVLVEQGATAFAQKPAEDLQKNLLFYVARSTAQSPLITEIRAQYKLEEALPSEEAIDAERAKLSGPDRQTMASVARAISEELARVKEALDIFMRGGEHSKIADLAPHLPTLKQVSDTIAMLGLGQQRKLVMEQHDLLKAVVDAGKFEDPAVLMDVAGALLYVEATLASQTDRPDTVVPESPQDALTQDEIAKARQAVIQECRAGLEQTKEKVVEYIASQWDRSHIQELPETLTGVRGGLHMIELDRAAAVLARAVDFVRGELLVDGAQPDWKRMDTLADALSSVEYFLERITEDPRSGGHILDIAEKSVAELGYAVPARAEQVQPAVDEVRAEPARAIAELITDEDDAALGAALDEALDISAEDTDETVAALDADAELPVLSESDDAGEFAERSTDELPATGIPLLADDEFAFPTEDVAADDAGYELPVVDDLVETVAEEPFAGDEELIVAALDDEPLLAEEDLVDMVDAAPRVDGVDAHELSDADISLDAPLLSDDFSSELADEPTLDVPMTAAQERKHSFVDEEIPLVDDESLAMDDMLLTDVVAEDDLTVVDDALLADALPDTEVIDERDLTSRDADALVDTELDAVVADVGHIVAEDEVADAAAVAEAVVVAAPAPAAAPAVAAADDDADAEEASVDEEIVEIFVEEIGEVMAHLDEYFPQWVANQQDEAALKEFRRGFHTLKGSGRMVGAKYVGELAWSIENMLNRVIDQTITPTPVLVDLIRTVMGIVPAMVDAFAKRRKPPYVVESLMECANAFARGEKPSSVPPLQLRGAPAAAPVVAEVVGAIDVAPVAVAVEIDEAGESAPVGDVTETIDTLAATETDLATDVVSGDDAAVEMLDVASASANAFADGDAALEELPSLDELPAEDGMLLDDGILAVPDEGGDLLGESVALDAGVPDAYAESVEELTTEDLTGYTVDELPVALPEVELTAESPEAVLEEDLSAEDFALTELADDTLPEGVPLAEVSADAAEEFLPEDVARDATETVADDVMSAVIAEEKSAADPDIDPVLIDVFSNESEQHLAAVEAWLANLDADLHFHPITDELLRALHTLKGSARMAGISPVAEIAGPTEKFCKELRNNGELADTDVVALVREAAGLIRLRVRHLLPDPYAPIPGAQSYLEMLEAISASRMAERSADENKPAQPLVCAVQPRPGLINDLLAEGLDHVLDGGDYAATWSQQGVVADDLEIMRAELRRLAVAADRAGMAPMVAVAQRLRRVYDGIHSGQVMLASQVLGALQQGHEAIIAMMDCMAAHQSIWPASEAEAALDAVSAGLPDIGAPEMPAEPELQDVSDFSADDMFSEAAMAEAEAEVLEKTGSVEPLDDFADVELAAEDLAVAEEEVIAESGTVEPNELLEPVELIEPGEPGDDLELVDEDTLALAAEAERTEVEAPTIAHTPQTQPATPVVHAPAAVPLAGDDDDDEDLAADRDPELVEIFLEEAAEIVESSGESLEQWLADVNNTVEVQKLQRDLHTLKGGARMAEIPQLGDLAHELENLYEGLSQGSLTAQPSLFRLLNRCHDRIADMVQDIRTRGRCKKGADLIERIHAYIKDPVNFTDEAPAVAVPVTAVADAPFRDAIAAPSDADSSAEAPASVPAATPQIAANEPVAPVATTAVSVPAHPAAPVAAEEPMPNVDADILEIFIEEAADLTAELDEALTHWRNEPANVAHADQIKRVMHTLKGGARLAGLKRLGDVSHDFETRIIELGPRAPDAKLFAELHAAQDEIGALVERVRAGGAAAAEAANAEAMAKAAAPVYVPPMDAPAVAPVVDVSPASVPLAAPAAPAPLVPAAPTAPAPTVQDESGPIAHRQAVSPTAARQAQPQEMVKVPSDLLEKLVNLAGETSINRSRIEQQVTDFRYTIAEMGSTISRLAEQLRRLNAEADEQVKANWEAGKAEGKYSGDFDPLEMDQYSGLHQLTKQLFESASDLLDIRDTLVNKSRDTETLLLQQSRVNTELQEGLMRSRMVPFSRLIPRLRRIVRQVAGELKKNVEIDFINPEGEMDRTLLERIVAPLEHMLRNACDHGVEDPQTRLAAGKAAQGRIRLALSREGGEVVLTVSDDGKGINVAAVRKKAIERGLMDANSEISDHDVMQFILEAGFSTAEKVTQISGRGVGMDVVTSEIKQMGGTLIIKSEVGKGTVFEIRLPFTVSVNRALMVRVAEDMYAIPLQQIEGIVRVSPYELEAYYGENPPPFEYAGASYRLSYLGGFVHGTAAPNLGGVIMPLPVLLVRGADHTVAIQVDQLIGSREVVVKAVGPQLSTVAGISGATILGDGRVVIILDLLSLVRAAHLQHEMQIAQQRRLEAQQAAALGKSTVKVRETPLIMVTDDSVTVRKVTGRFLERQGFEVITAKDGMDAVAQLVDVKPDLMLLDIEMPRMDGFEVAAHCRHDSRLKDLPIIMITSRTGEKHRERAMDIGVNAYLGKPFQENELLAKIQELLAERRALAQG